MFKKIFEMTKTGDPHWTGEENEPEFKVGERILHPIKGLGVIKKIIGDDIYIVFDEDDSNIGTKLNLPSLIKYNLIYKSDEEEEKKRILKKNKKTPTKPKNSGLRLDGTIQHSDEEEEMEEEMEEEEDEDAPDIVDDLDEEELMIMKVDEFFSDEEIQNNLVTLEDILEYRDGLNKKFYELKNLNPFQKKILGRRLAITYIIERYFNHLAEVFPAMKIYRFIGEIPYDEMWEIRKKGRIPFYKEMYDIHGFDNGVIFYWILNDGVVFKTLENRKRRK